MHFELATDPSQLRVAASALSVGEHGVRVATVDADDRVKFKSVIIAKDFGAKWPSPPASTRRIESSTIRPKSLADGDQVRIAGKTAADAKE